MFIGNSNESQVSYIFFKHVEEMNNLSPDISSTWEMLNADLGRIGN